MEIRRIEGVFLQHAIEQSQTLMAQKTSENLRIKILSVVPEVLLDLSSAGSGIIKARVTHLEGSMVSLTLPNGIKLKAENKSYIPFVVGDILDLMIESTKPFILKITGLYRKSPFESLLMSIFEGKEDFSIPINIDNLEESIKHSGLFYERKILDLLFGKIKPEDLLKDIKAQLLRQVFGELENLSRKFGVNFSKDMDGLKELIGSLKARVETIKDALKTLKTLRLENIHKEEYLKNLKSFGREVEEIAEDLLKVIEEGSKSRIIQFNTLLEKSVGELEKLTKLYQGKIDYMENILHKLELLNQLQWFMVNKGKAFLLPLIYQDGKGGIMFRVDDDYTVFFKLNYERGFVAGILKRPKTKSILDVRIITDIYPLATFIREKKETLRNMLSEEGIELKSFVVEFFEEKRPIEDIILSLSEEGFLLLA